MKKIMSYATILILIFVVFSTFNYVFSKDIIFYDEVSYLEKGVYLNNHIFEDGFIYYIYYKILSIFIAEKVTIYKVSNLILILSNYIIIYTILTGKKNKDLIILLISLFYTSTKILDLWPFITLFTSIFIMYLIYSLQTKKNNKINILVILFILVYIRPEFTYSFYLYLVFIIINSIIKKKYFSINYYIFALLLIIINIKNNVLSIRAHQAFAQHYTLRLHQLGLIPKSINPWTTTYYFDLIFPNTNSLFQILLIYPEKLFKHIWSNFLDIPINILSLLNDDISLIPMYLFLIILIILYVRNYLNKLIIYNKNIILFVILLSPILSSALIIYPRDHYLFQLLIIIFVFIYTPISKLNISTSIYYISYAITIFLLLSNVHKINLKYSENKKLSCTNEKIINTINELYIKNSNILTVRGNICSMVSENKCKHIFEWEKQENWNEFYRKFNINLVLVEENLKNDYRYSSDNAFLNFINNHENRIKVCDKVYLYKL